MLAIAGEPRARFDRRLNAPIARTAIAPGAARHDLIVGLGLQRGTAESRIRRNRARERW